MSDLQTALLATGAALIVAVLVYNKWQEAKYRRQSERGFSDKPADALIVDRIPGEESTQESEDRTESGSHIRVEPSFPKRRIAQSPGGMVSNPLPPCSIIDYCIDIEADTEIPCPVVIEAAVRLLADFTKAVHLDGYDSEAGEWRNLGHEGAYSALRGSIQLVDRRGTIETDELEKFDSAVRKLATGIGATSRPADLGKAMEAAKRLDRFCSEVDVQIGLNVVSQGTRITGGLLLDAAQDLGMDLDMDGSFHRRDSNKRTMFRLSNIDNAAFSSTALKTLTTAAVTFEIDVPRTLPQPGLIDELYDAARQLAERIEGKVVDDNQIEVGELSRDAIRAQLNAIHVAMNDHGIPAGEALALRLFS